jgi:serine/threonine protein kinase
MTVIGLSGTYYQLDSNLLSDGGEGEIYRVLGITPKKVAKIYKTGISTRELEEKLIIMVNRPPNSKVLSQVAWPLDVVYDTNKRFCGFIMPELNINAELGKIYKYPSQINISSLQKIIIAENICAAISEVHKAGYVFGDFNPRNIGVDKNTGTVAFLDTDTYHVVDPSQNKAYRCNVCAPGYSAPELLEKCANHISANPNDKSQAYAKTPLPTFTKETDNFALAVHIFKLLMNGYTPYGGIKDTASASQTSPGTGDAAVKRDNYCFKPGFRHQSVAIPSLDTFPQEISDLFTRAFILSKIDPKQRPFAVEWHKALEKYEKTLISCSTNPLHQYGRNNSSCPLCEADQRYENVMSPQISQKTYSGTVQPPAQISIKPTPPLSLGSQVGAKPHISVTPSYNLSTKSSSKNWWKRLSSGAKTAVVAVSISVLVLGFGVFNGWFDGNTNIPTTQMPTTDSPTTMPITHSSTTQPSATENLPRLVGFVNDYARVMRQEDIRATENLAVATQQRAGVQIVVVTVQSFAPFRSIEEFSIALAENWGLGQRGEDTGVILVLAVSERRVRIEVGSGLRRVISDSVAGRILDTAVLPAFQRGDFSEGLRLGVNSIATTITR